MTELPPAVLEAMCGRLRLEGMTTQLRVVNETEAIITPAALQAMALSSFERRPPKPEAVQAILLTPLIPLAMPTKPCAQSVTAAEAARLSDVMLIQFSSPFVNPFERGQSGTLARLSLGGEASTWYWIPLVYRNDRWLAGTPSVLSVME